MIKIPPHLLGLLPTPAAPRAVSSWVAYKKLRQIRKSAQKRGLTVDLTTDDVRWLMSCPACPLCGRPFVTAPRDRGPQILRQMTFERTDPNKGYTRDNVIPGCFECNTKKARRDAKIVDREPRLRQLLAAHERVLAAVERWE